MEDYEKKYKEALERAKGLCADGHFDQIALEGIFPELEENEDEKIRKEIVDFICWATDRGSITSEQREKCKSWFAWLEKQGEKNLANFANNCKDGQKSVEWIEEDEKIKESIITGLEMLKDGASDKSLIALYNKKIDWLKSLRPQSHWKPTEWSEKDEKMRTRLAACLGYHYHDGMMTRKEYEEAYNWLKSLYPQPKQEWSEEDKKRINHIIQFLEDKDRWKDNERAFPIEEDVRWLKFLKNRVIPQQPH